MTTSAETSSLVIYGAGEHGLVLAETAHACGIKVLGFVDDRRPPAAASPWRRFEIDAPEIANTPMIVAIGENAARQRVVASLIEAGRNLATLIHPSACVSGSARIGRGVWIGPLAVVHSEALIGDAAIINSAAVVEHHCEIGRCVHIAPGAVLGGRVVVNDGALVGLGARVLPRVSIGAECTIGAGAVVLDDVTDETTVVGCPAHPV